MSDVEILGRVSKKVWLSAQRGWTDVDALVRETGRYGGRLFFGFVEEDGELFDGGHGNITPVVSSKQGLYMDISVRDVVMKYDGRSWCPHLALQVEEEHG